MAKTSYKKWGKVLERELKRHLKNNKKKDSSHGIDHIERTWEVAEKIGKARNADMELLIAMVYLHDLGECHCDKLRHGKEGARKAKQILRKIKFPQEKIGDVIEAIEAHDLTDVHHHKLEAKILFDADKVDSFGAVGVSRWLDSYSMLGFDLKEAAPRSLRNLKKRYRKLYTREAKRIKRKDYEFTKKYFEKLCRELEAC